METSTHNLPSHLNIRVCRLGQIDEGLVGGASKELNFKTVVPCKQENKKVSVCT